MTDWYSLLMGHNRNAQADIAALVIMWKALCLLALVCVGLFFVVLMFV